jgi:hypothetical protein
MPDFGKVRKSAGALLSDGKEMKLTGEIYPVDAVLIAIDETFDDERPPTPFLGFRIDKPRPERGYFITVPDCVDADAPRHRRRLDDERRLEPFCGLVQVRQGRQLRRHLRQSALLQPAPGLIFAASELDGVSRRALQAKSLADFRR